LKRHYAFSGIPDANILVFSLRRAKCGNLNFYFTSALGQKLIQYVPDSFSSIYNLENKAKTALWIMFPNDFRFLDRLLLIMKYIKKIVLFIV